MQRTMKRKFLASIEKKFGKALALFADDDIEDLQRLPLGIAQLDWLTLGGIPLGKITMLRGPESGTKTTLAVIACARYLERFPDKLAIYIDAEEKYPKQFVKRLGIDGSRFATVTPETAEETIDFVEHSLRDRAVGILVLDSIAAIVPKIEIDASAEQWQQGLAARQMNKMIRKTVGALKSARLSYGTSPTVVLVNQERFKIGIIYGDPTTLPGGQGQLYAASLSIRLRSLTRRKSDEDGINIDAPVVKVAANIVKHSFGPKGRGTEYLLAMETFNGLLAGEANDEDFVRRQAKRLGLVKSDGKIEAEILKRGARYRSFKTEIIQSMDRARKLEDRLKP